MMTTHRIPRSFEWSTRRWKGSLIRELRLVWARGWTQRWNGAMALCWSACWLAWPGAVSAANIDINVAAPVVTIPETMFGGNLAQYEGTGDDFGQPAYTGGVTAMQVAGLKNIRIPGGIWADKWNWSYAAAGSDAYLVDVYEMLRNITDYGGGAAPQCIVNFSGVWRDRVGGPDVTHSRAATVQLAADFVQYMNVTHSYNVKWWEVGNEVFANWHPNKVTGTNYGTEFADFYKAMKAKDPTIKVGALAAVEDNYRAWSQDALVVMKAKGVVPDFLAAHHYKDNDILGRSVNDSAGFTVLFDGWVSAIYGPAYVGQIKYFMTEFRTRGRHGSVGDNRYRNSFMDAIFTLQYLMELAKNGWEGANIWANKLIYKAGPPITDFGLVERNTNDPYPTWYMYPYMTGYMGRRMVQTTDDLGDTLRAYGTLNAAGDLVIAVVNNSETAAQAVTVNVTGGTVNAATGELFQILPIGTTTMGLADPPNLRMQVSINGVNDPCVTCVAGIPAQSIPVGQSFTLNIPANCVQFIKVPLAPLNTPPTGRSPGGPANPSAKRRSRCDSNSSRPSSTHSGSLTEPGSDNQRENAQ